MIAESGLLLLWLAAALAMLQALAGFAGLSQRGDLVAFATAARPVAVLQGLLCIAAFGCLIAVFVRTDLSVLLVADNSHSAKPLLFKFAGAWGNHEGSMLLWLTILGLGSIGVALFERRLAPRIVSATLGAQAVLALGFYAFLLFASNPFARLSPVPAEGAGLNPLLQDPGLAFHPPTLYLGYVGLSVAFSFAVGAMLARDADRAFARAMRPWVLIAWIFLTLGITAGSYWAYYELGWGGWWFWDPVENASLMPWLAATALLHSVSVTANRDGLRAWTIMLALVAFSMSMIGTFIVRSGLLTSVHSFAVDPTRGVFILALLALYIGGALALFGARIGSVTSGATFTPISREGALVMNNLLLSVILAIVLIGTFYPIAAEALGYRLSVGPPYFDRTAGPIALGLVALLFVGPLLRWRRDTIARIPVVAWAALGIAGVGAIALAMLVPRTTILPAFGLALGIGLSVASVLPLVRRSLKRTPATTWAMVCAHFGVAVALIGMASNAAFTEERLIALRSGETTTVGPWQVELSSIDPVVGPNWTAIEATIAARYDGGATNRLAPQLRAFTTPPTETSEAALLTRWNGQLYAVLGQPTSEGRWQLRLWWKPFVTLIWLGGILIALGGAISLVARIGLLKRARHLIRRVLP
jgi:cytochrome c-type biogenesis protein CcmF